VTKAEQDKLLVAAILVVGLIVLGTGKKAGVLGR
jgi:hypothetical protein